MGARAAEGAAAASGAGHRRRASALDHLATLLRPIISFELSPREVELGVRGEARAGLGQVR